MWWISISENAFTGALLKELVIFDFCVEPTVGLWQVAHPIALNKELPAAIVCEGTCCPFNTTPPAGGGARVRMKSANAETSSRTAAPADPGLFASSG
jgi:hypothetical protein